MIRRVGITTTDNFLKALYRVNFVTTKYIKNIEEVEIIKEINEDIKKIIDKCSCNDDDLNPLRDLCSALASHEDLSLMHRAMYGWYGIKLKQTE